MSRHRFEAYLDKVFGFSERVRAMPEGRQSPRHPWHKVFNAVFLGAAMQAPSLLQIQAECRSGALAKRIGPISDDTFGYALQRQSPEAVFALGCEVASRLKRNGVLRSDGSRGLRAPGMRSNPRARPRGSRRISTTSCRMTIACRTTCTSCSAASSTEEPWTSSSRTSRAR